MPAAQSALQIHWNDSGEGKMGSSWGLLASEAQVMRHGIPTNEAVQRIPAGKALGYFFAAREFEESMEADQDRRHPIDQHILTCTKVSCFQVSWKT